MAQIDVNDSTEVSDEVRSNIEAIEDNGQLTTIICNIGLDSIVFAVGIDWRANATRKWKWKL